MTCGVRLESDFQNILYCCNPLPFAKDTHEKVQLYYNTKSSVKTWKILIEIAHRY